MLNFTEIDLEDQVQVARGYILYDCISSAIIVKLDCSKLLQFIQLASCLFELDFFQVLELYELYESYEAIVIYSFQGRGTFL